MDIELTSAKTSGEKKFPKKFLSAQKTVFEFQIRLHILDGISEKHPL